MHKEVRACMLPVLVAISGILGGCASTAEISQETGGIVRAQWEQLDGAPTCCADYQVGDFIPAAADGLKLNLDPGKARNFESGKSYFVGVELAALKGAPMLVIKSHQNLPRRNGLPYVVRPSYVVLDEGLGEISGGIDVPLCYARGWGERETGYFGVIQLDESRSWGVVFHTSSSSRGTFVKYSGNATTAGGGAVVEASVNYSFPAAPVGELEVLPLTDHMRSYLEKKCPQLLNK